MEDLEPTPFIFYLSLGESLPADFYVFDRCFKELGFLLVPVKIDQFQTLLASSDQSHILVLSSVRDSVELKTYNEKVRGLLKFVLKSKTLSFIHLSSFAKTNDTRTFCFYRNYYFVKYPVAAGTLAPLIAAFYEEKTEQSSRWPGGKRAGVGSMAA